MPSYWVKRFAGGEPEGPFSGAQLKEMAAGGRIAGTSLVSADRLKWTVASKVKGLFPAPIASEPVAPLRPLVAPPPAGSDTYDLAEQPPPQQPVFAAPAPVAVQPLAYSSGPPRHRDLQWYVLLASVLLGLGVMDRVFNFAYGMRSSFSNTYSVLHQVSPAPGAARPSLVVEAVAVIVALILFFGMIGLYAYFTVWVYLAHRDMQEFTEGAYPISPARACGFCWIPLFNLFWLVYMPYKLAEAVEWHLGPGRPIVKADNIAWMQVGSFIACCCVAGLSNFLLASTAKQIQAGLNDLWRNPIQVPGRGW